MYTRSTPDSAGLMCNPRCSPFGIQGHVTAALRFSITDADTVCFTVVVLALI